MSAQKPHRKIAPPAPSELPAVIESLLFVAEEPQDISMLAKSLDVPRRKVEQAVEALAASVAGRGIIVQRLGYRVQLATAPDAAPYIEQFLEVDHGRLSRASLETLAIVAYRQPVSRAGIEAVRGVNSDYAVATLVARGLIEDVGRAPGPGRPVLFGTAVRFLEYFGLQRQDDLPPLPAAVSEIPEGLSAAAPPAVFDEQPAEPEDGAQEATVFEEQPAEPEDGAQEAAVAVAEPDGDGRPGA